MFLAFLQGAKHPRHQAPHPQVPPAPRREAVPGRGDFNEDKLLPAQFIE